MIVFLYSSLTKSVRASFWLLTAAIALWSCSDESEGFPPFIDEPAPMDTIITLHGDTLVPPKKITIMPFGASRVKGKRPNFESYRYDLWKRVVDAEWQVDFIGTEKDRTRYKKYKGRVFDPDHEGHGGWSSGEMLEQIDGWLEKAGAPDIVLFSSPGGNDALRNLPYEETLENVNALIDAMQRANPKVTIIIEQLAPAREEAMSERLSDFIYRMQEDVLSISEEKSTDSSYVIPVDMYSNFEEIYFADDIHYNDKGARFIGRRYFKALDKIID